MIKVKKCSVHASVSVLAMVLSASMALADADQTVAGPEDEYTPEVVVCEFYPGAEAVVDVAKGDETDVTIELAEAEAEPESGPVDGEDLPVYYMSANGGPVLDMVKRDAVLVRHESVAHDPASVPNLCDIAGPGLDWLCGGKTR